VSSTLAQVGGRTFASLRKHRNYRLYFAGNLVSFTGTWMQQIAAAWLVLRLTHSPVLVGALALCQLLPVTALGLFVGTLIDRYDVRRLVIRAEILQMANAALLAGLTITGVVRVWEVFVLAAIQGIVGAIDAPARHSLVFQMVGPDDLANAVALSSSVGTMARVLGPAIGGAVVATAGEGTAFALNSLSFLGILASLLAMDVTKLHRPGRSEEAKVLKGAIAALSYVRHTPRATVAFVVVFAIATFAFNFNVLFPLIAERTLHKGAGTFGVIAAVFGMGAFTGAMINAFRAVASVRTIILGAVGYGALELVLAPLHSLVAICVLLYFIGIFYILWGTNALTTIQLAAPPHLRGRAASLYFFAFQGGAPLGGLFAGVLVSWGGTELAYVVGGTVSLLTAVWGIWFLASRAGGTDRSVESVAGIAHALHRPSFRLARRTSPERGAELDASETLDDPVE
jgi:MFS family permease